MGAGASISTTAVRAEAVQVLDIMPESIVVTDTRAVTNQIAADGTVDADQRKQERAL